MPAGAWGLANLCGPPVVVITATLNRSQQSPEDRSQAKCFAAQEISTSTAALDSRSV